MAKHATINEWLVKLAIRCAPTKGEEDLVVRIQSYLPGLAELPDGVFVAASLEAVSRLFEFFPAYAPLRRALEQWLKRNPLPRTQLALPGQADVMAALEAANLTAEDRCAVRLWIEHRVRGDLTDKEFAIRLGVIRRMNEPGYRWLLGSGNTTGAAGIEAARIAVRMKWETAGRQPGDWTDPDSVRASLRGILEPTPHWMAKSLLAMLRDAVTQHAPENLHLLPESVGAPRPGKDFEEERLARAKSAVPPADLNHPPTTPPASDALADFEAKHGRPAGALTPEQLKAAREANPTSATLLHRTPAPPPADPPPGPTADFASNAAANAADVHADHIAMPWDDPP
jgi:hypothetical protein